MFLSDSPRDLLQLVGKRHEPIHGNLEREAVIATKDLLNLHWERLSSTHYNHRHQQVGNPQEKPRGQSQVHVLS